MPVAQNEAKCPDGLSPTQKAQEKTYRNLGNFRVEYYRV